MTTEAHGQSLARQHRHEGMSGRDPHEVHRAATPLELLYDLTFVISFGSAANQLAHSIGDGHIASGVVAFIFVMFGTCWAWINYSWFASAYDPDDWGFRLATFVQMVGVIIFSLGIPAAFKSIDSGSALDNRVIVFGYVIMRLAMVFLWIRAGREDPRRRKTCFTYAILIVIAQIGWIAMALAQPGWGATIVFGILLFLLELSAPVIAEQKMGEGGTPWHAHHIAERYGLLAIIALGEGIIGTVATVGAIVEHQGWSAEAIMMCAAGVGLTFSMWWIYFILPSAAVLHAHRERAFAWGYFHMVLFAAIAAMGAGLHVVGTCIEQKAKIAPVVAIASTAISVAIFIGGVYLLYFILLRRSDRLHVWLLAGTAAVLVASVLLSALGASLTVCLAVLTLAPLVSVIGYEMAGVHHIREAVSAIPGGADKMSGHGH